jgi:hypothetical protein
VPGEQQGLDAVQPGPVWRCRILGHTQAAEDRKHEKCRRESSMSVAQLVHGFSSVGLALFE